MQLLHAKSNYERWNVQCNNHKMIWLYLIILKKPKFNFQTSCVHRMGGTKRCLRHIIKYELPLKSTCIIPKIEFCCLHRAYFDLDGYVDANTHGRINGHMKVIQCMCMYYGQSVGLKWRKYTVYWFKEVIILKNFGLAYFHVTLHIKWPNLVPYLEVYMVSTQSKYMGLTPRYHDMYISTKGP